MDNVIEVFDAKIYILETYTNSKYWWKKDPLVIPHGLSWSKIGNFEKGGYGTLFAEWYNPILSMAPTSNELLQPWFIRSMEYFRSHDVEHEPLLIVHDVEHERQLLLKGQPVGENPVVALEQQSEPDVAVERQYEPNVALERQSEPEVALERQSEPNVPMFTREELVAEHHAIKERVQIIKNVADADPSIVLQQLAAIKERITAIETFLKYKNEFVSEDFVVYWISQYKLRNDGLAKFLKRESNLSSERKHI
ncbi:hypothetical protein Tco_0349487 [Tanacetum coccineum]